MLPRLRTSINLPSLLEDFFNDSFLTRFFNWDEYKTIPAVNIIEGKDEYKIEVAAPGLSKEDFKVELDGNVLTISSEKEQKKEEKDENVLRREFCYSSFRRSFTLPDDVNIEKIKASHNDGILTVTLPKKEEAKAKPVKEIKIS